MIVVGVDPGARWTGLAIVDGRTLLASCTIERPGASELLDVEPAYLTEIAAGVVDAVRHRGAELLAVERVRRPSWRIKGTEKPLDPTAIMATAVVFGGIIGRGFGVPLVTIPPDGNGSRPWTTYPAQLRPREGGKGGDKLRHERSAYDVATLAVQYRALARARGTVYP